MDLFADVLKHYRRWFVLAVGIFALTVWQAGNSLAARGTDTVLTGMVEYAKETPGQSPKLQQASSPPVTRSIPQPSPPVTKHNQESASALVYQLIKAFLHFTRNEEVLFSKTSAPLSQKKRAELRSWITTVSFAVAGDPTKKTSLEQCRAALLEYIDIPPSDGFNTGFKRGEVSLKQMLMLANFGIDAKTAKAQGHYDLAEYIEALQNLSKGLLMIGLGFDKKKLDAAKPTVRCFIEYYAIYMGLYEPKNEASIPRSALMAMKPGAFKDPYERDLFIALHHSLRDLSNAVQRKDTDQDVKLEVLMNFVPIATQCGISEKEIVNAGGAAILNTFKQMKTYGTLKGR